MLRLSLDIFIFDTSYKNPSFSRKIFIKIKNPPAKTKGLESQGSPNKTIFKLFAGVRKLKKCIKS
jgi:hypothetical protein